MRRVPVPIPSVIVKKREAEKGERRRQARGAEKKSTASQQDSPNYIAVRTPTGMTVGVPLSLLSCVVQFHSEYSARAPELGCLEKWVPGVNLALPYPVMRSSPGKLFPLSVSW